MLATLLIWTYTSVVFYLYGWGTIALLFRLLKINTAGNQKVPLLVITGAAAVTTLASYLSLMIPISGLAFILIGAGAGLIALWGHPFKSVRFPDYHGLVWITLVLLGLLLLENATHAPQNPDTALYHAQAIHWIEVYPAVPGLTNLYNRLGYNPSWFVLNAVFSLAFLAGRSFHLTGGIFMFFALVYFSEGLNNILHRSFSIYDIAKSIFFVLAIVLFDSDVSSPATDMPSTLLIWVTLLCWAEQEGPTGQVGQNWIAVILSAYAVTVKLSTLPLLLIPLLAIFRQLRSRSVTSALLISAIGFGILLPWIMRNIVLSGYLVFPLAQIDIISADWKYPREYTLATRDGIMYFARFPSKNWREFIGLPAGRWIPVWFDNLSANQQILVLLAALSPLLMLPVFLKNRYSTAKGLVVVIACLGMLFWFLAAPDIRFGYGFLFMTIILSASLMIFPIAARMLQFAEGLRFVPAVLTLLFLGCAFFQSMEPASINRRLFLPLDYRPSQAAPCPIRNGIVFCREEGYQCNYDAFPCTAKVRSNLEMRGPSFRDGFRITP